MRKALLLVATAALVGSLAPATATAAPVKQFKNCVELNKTYKHGVGKKGARDKVKSGKPVTNFTVNDAVYNQNKARDGDKDGIACEKH